MARQIADRIKELTNTQGTGPITLTGAIQGYGAFVDAFGDGAGVYYGISTGQEFEIGYGTYTAPSTLSRDTVYAKLEGGTYEKNPATPLDIQNGAEVYAAFTQAAWDEIVASIADLSGVQDQPTARLNLGFIDEILDKKAPGDIGLGTQARGAFTNLSIGHAVNGDHVDIRAVVPIFNMQFDDDNRFRFAVDGATTVINSERSAQSLISINPMASDGAGDSRIQVFRFTNTTGLKAIQLYKGDNTSEIDTQFGVDGTASFIKEGNFGIGIDVPNAALDIRKADPRITLINSADNQDSVHISTVGNWGIINKYASGQALITVNPVPGDGTGLALFSLFRNTVTTGSREFRMYSGDGSSNIVNLFSSHPGGNSYLNNGGNFGIGTNDPRDQLEVSDSSTCSLILRNTAQSPQQHTNLQFATGAGAISATNSVGRIRSRVVDASPLTSEMGFFVNVGDAQSEAMNIWEDRHVSIFRTASVGISNIAPNAALTVSAGNVTPFITNSIDLGDSSRRWRDAYLQNAPTVTSDERAKENIQDLDTLDVTGLVMGLRPVSFTHRGPEVTIQSKKTVQYKAIMGMVEKPDPVTGQISEVPGPVLKPTVVDGPKEQIELDSSTHFGFIAQEVETLLNTLNIDPNSFAPLTYNADDDVYGFRYSEMVALLTEFVQAQQHKITDLETRLSALEAA